MAAIGVSSVAVASRATAGCAPATNKSIIDAKTRGFVGNFRRALILTRKEPQRSRQARPAIASSSSSGGSLRTDSSISLGTAVIPGDVDLPVLESVLYKWANNITQSSNLPLPFAARVDKIPSGFRISSMVMSTSGTLESEVDIIVTVSPAQGTEPAMFRAIREGRETAPEWEPGLMKAMLTTLLEGVKIARKT